MTTYLLTYLLLYYYSAIFVYIGGGNTSCFYQHKVVPHRHIKTK